MALNKIRAKDTNKKMNLNTSLELKIDHVVTLFWRSAVLVLLFENMHSGENVFSGVLLPACIRGCMRFLLLFIRFGLFMLFLLG